MMRMILYIIIIVSVGGEIKSFGGIHSPVHTETIVNDCRLKGAPGKDCQILRWNPLELT